jgi:hypothetical protein
MAIMTRRKQQWEDVDPSRARALGDARLQLHHAAQLVAALGISYLPKAADDSHTNMEWFSGVLASNVVGPRPFRLGVRPSPLSLVVLAGDAELASYALDGKTIAAAAEWVRGQVKALGLEPARYTLDKHYTIPDHPVGRGAAFDATDDRAFDQLRRWYNDGAALLTTVAAEQHGSPVRCWPHHFDIATVIDVAPGETIGVGLEPGDGYYDEPYWYVNRYPAPGATTATELTSARLEGGGRWHTREWIGAVLPGSDLAAGDLQREQCVRFLAGAIAVCRASFRD